MKRSDFNEKFDSLVKKVNEPLSTEEGILKMLENYAEDSTKITQNEMFIALFMESRKYTNQLSYKLFSEFLDIED